MGEIRASVVLQSSAGNSGVHPGYTAMTSEDSLRQPGKSGVVCDESAL